VNSTVDLLSGGSASASPVARSIYASPTILVSMSRWRPWGVREGGQVWPDPESSRQRSVSII